MLTVSKLQWFAALAWPMSASGLHPRMGTYCLHSALQASFHRRLFDFLDFMAEVQMPSEAQLRSAVEEVIDAKDPSRFTLGALRGALEVHFNLPGGSLDEMAETIKSMAKVIMEQPAQAHDEAEEEIVFPKIVVRFLSIASYPLSPFWENNRYFLSADWTPRK